MARNAIAAATGCSHTEITAPPPQGGQTAICPTLPGVVAEGDTLEGTRALAAAAIRCHRESLQIDGLPIPAGKALNPARREAVATVALATA